MKRKKPSLYDAEEQLLQEHSVHFVEYLQRKGVLEDAEISDEKIRKAQKSRAKKAYQNTEVMLAQYRLIVWTLECVPGELAQELDVPLRDVDSLVEKLDLQSTLQNKRFEYRINAMMKTRYLVDRIHEALSVLKQKPINGDQLYAVIYTTYIDPIERTHEDILEILNLSDRTYYRLRREAITIMSIRLWSAPSEDTASWLEVLTIIEIMYKPD